MVVYYVHSIQQFPPHLVINWGFHIGLDCEWKPNYTRNQDNPVALLQIATETDTYLFQLTRLRLVPLQVRAMLENPQITKSGVGIREDVQKLWRDWRVNVASVVDLALLAKTIDSALFANRLGRYKDLGYYPRSLPPSPPPENGDEQKPWKYDPYEKRVFRGSFKESIGLSRLAIAFMGQTPMKKGKTSPQRSNWEAHLTSDQIKYAAEDAELSGGLYFSILRQITDEIPMELLNEKYWMCDCTIGKLYHKDLKPWGPDNPTYDPAPMPRAEKKHEEGKEESKQGKEASEKDRERVSRKQVSHDRGHGTTSKPSQDLVVSVGYLSLS